MWCERTLVHEALHQAEQVAVVVPDVHLGDHAAILVAGGGALLDERLQRVAAARQHRIAGRQRERGAQVVGAVPAIHDALVGVLPPQVLQLLALCRQDHCQCRSQHHLHHKGSQVCFLQSGVADN